MALSKWCSQRPLSLLPLRLKVAQLKESLKEVLSNEMQQQQQQQHMSQHVVNVCLSLDPRICKVS